MAEVMATPAKKNDKDYSRTYRPKSAGSEGPKKSVAKPTAAQSAAAKKKAAVKKSSSEGPKRSTVKPSSTAMAIAKAGKPKVVESGVGNIPASIVRLGMAIAKQVGRTGSQPKALPEKTIREAAQFKKLMDQQSARTAAASARQTAGRKAQLAKEAKEVKTSGSSQTRSDRQNAQVDAYRKKITPAKEKEFAKNRAAEVRAKKLAREQANRNAAVRATARREKRPSTSSTIYKNPSKYE